MRILDLFCGAGGFAHGFLQASSCYNVTLAIDTDFRALQTYDSNIRNNQIFNKDIHEIHSYEILDRSNEQFPDIVISSPPCESFSIANPKRQKSAYDQLYADETGRLVLDTIRIIIDLEPRVFIIENVPQLATMEMKGLISHEFSHSIYETIHFNILEAQNFGVPSQRKRVFISNIILKSSTINSLVSASEAFRSLPNPNIKTLNHGLIPVSPNVAKKITKIQPGGAIVYFRGSQGRTFRNYIKLRADQPSPTVMGKSRFIHPYYPRLCTVREHACLMSYPDDFQFYGPINWQYNQVGESVPPLLAKAVAQQVLATFPKN